MSQPALLAVIAVGLGIVVAAVVFAPLVALAYRRADGFGVGRFVLWGAALAYVLAIWVAALLPFPDPAAIACAETNLELFAFVDDLPPVTVPPTVLLTVLLFAPLGFFVRILLGRGIPSAILAGLAVSTFVEVTQLTRVWLLYPCPYRAFDVDDLLAGTIGAVLGSLAALAVPRRLWEALRPLDAELPHPVTPSRRLLGMLSDALGMWLTASAIAVAVRLVLGALGAEQALRAGTAAHVVGSAGALVVWLVVVLTTGRTVGDHAVLLRFEGGPVFVPIARFLRFVAGIGGFALLIAFGGAWVFVGSVLAVASIVLVFATDDRRGLAGLASGQRLVDAREPVLDAPDEGTDLRP